MTRLKGTHRVLYVFPDEREEQKQELLSKKKKKQKQMKERNAPHLRLSLGVGEVGGSVPS